MPLPIPDPLKDRLVEQLTEELGNATVFANAIVSTWSLRGLSGIKSLPNNGELTDLLRRFIGDDPFATFVIDELDVSFIGPGVDREAAEAPLSTYEGYRDLGVVASSMVDSFSTLPWSYCLTIRLPNSFGELLIREVGDYDLSPRHRIVSGKTLQANFPQLERQTGLMSLMMGSTPTSAWHEDSAYLHVATEGYFRNKQTEPFLSARDDVLTFFGLGIALRLFNENPFETPDSEGKPTNFYVHRLISEVWSAQSTLNIEDHYRDGFVRIALMDADPTVINEKLDRIGSVFRSENGKNIALSARWLFNSTCGKDALLQYIQAAVAIEILLGDEDADPNVGLTTLMANRFAYSIAKTPLARTQLLKMFRDIYRVRSKIVHRGKSRLNQEELRLFRALQMLLRLVIDNEQRLLERAEINRTGRKG